MKKILFINPHYPIFGTTVSGGANRSQMLLKALTMVGHVDLVSMWEGEVSNIPNCTVIFSAQKSFLPDQVFGRYEKFIRLLAPWNANNIFPINKSMERFVDEYVKRDNYDYIAVRYLFTAARWGLLKYADKLILDVDDHPRNTILLRGQNAVTIPEKIYRELSAYSAILMSRSVLNKVYCSFFSNQDERPSSKSVFLHNVSVQTTILPPVTDQTLFRVLVVGKWSYAPNKNGLIHFMKNVWPIVHLQQPNAELRVVGMIEDEELINECQSVPMVTVCGFVEDLMDEYNNARCVVIPIYSGSGTCVKTIEAMQVNRPVVSTTCGLRGMTHDMQDGQDYLLAEDDSIFAKHVVKLLTMPQYGAFLSSNALGCVSEKYSAEQFKKIVKQSIQGA